MVNTPLKLLDKFDSHCNYKYSSLK